MEFVDDPVGVDEGTKGTEVPGSESVVVPGLLQADSWKVTINRAMASFLARFMPKIFHRVLSWKRVKPVPALRLSCP